MLRIIESPPETDPQLVRPVIVTLPRDLGGVQILVQHYADGPVVNVREGSWSTWVPACLADVNVETRES